MDRGAQTARFRRGKGAVETVRLHGRMVRHLRHSGELDVRRSREQIRPRRGDEGVDQGREPVRHDVHAGASAGSL